LPAVEFRILAINPGATSTKIAVYANERAEVVRNLRHPDEEMEQFRGRPILDQLEFREALIEGEVKSAGYALNQLHAVAGRGGLLRPLASGTYRVNREMLDELRAAPYGEHASNLGAHLAHAVAQLAGIEAYIVDPVSVDEFCDLARLSGSALLERQSLSHALNTKAVAKRFSIEQGRRYEDQRLIVVHLGSGTSVSAHAGGRMIDLNNGRQEGPFSTDRAGGLPAMKLVELCFSGKYTMKQIDDLMCRQGGIFSYLGTKDLVEVERRIASGDAKSRLVFDAMIYQIAKEIGGLATVLMGRVDAILFTGGMANSEKLVRQLQTAIEWIAPVHLYPGEDELEALAGGALRVLCGEEPAREFGTATEKLQGQTV